MKCPRPNCGNMAFERRVLAHGHEIVESYCVAGHAQFVSSRPLVIVDRTLDQETLDEIAERKAKYGVFPDCGHVRLAQYILRQGNRVVCRICTMTMRDPYERRSVRSAAARAGALKRWAKIRKSDPQHPWRKNKVLA